MYVASRIWKEIAAIKKPKSSGATKWKDSLVILPLCRSYRWGWGKVRWTHSVWSWKFTQLWDLHFLQLWLLPHNVFYTHSYIPYTSKPGLAEGMEKNWVDSQPWSWWDPSPITPANIATSTLHNIATPRVRTQTWTFSHSLAEAQDDTESVEARRALVYMEG